MSGEHLSELARFEALIGRKDKCAPEVFHAWLAAREQLLDSLKRATWDLAVHTFHGKDTSLGEEADRLYLLYLDRGDRG